MNQSLTLERTGAERSPPFSGKLASPTQDSKSCPRAGEQSRSFQVKDPATYAYLEKAVRKACPHWLKHHEDDIVQKAALKVFRILNAEDSPKHVAGSYLYRVASTVVIDSIRGAARKTANTAPLDETATGPRPDQNQSQQNPERSAGQRQIGRAILECMSRLLRDRRMALSLKLQGYSNREAAKMLGWAEKRTENLASRGQVDLRTCLAKKGIAACG